jgi:acetyl-CoA carboxylase biotin carboxyl carrier protein
MDELRELVELIAKHGFTDFELEREGFRVRLGRELPSQTQTSAPASSTAAAGQAAAAGLTVASSSSQSYDEGVGGRSVQAQSAALDYDASTSEAGAPQQQQQQGATPSEDEGLHIIPSPIVGTFYRSPSPTAEPFVRLGSQVNPDTVVCIIEAMKLMNEILAEMSGEVVKIYVENGQPVEYNQPLFGIKK